MARRFQLHRATKRVDGTDRVNERVPVVEGDLDLKPFDTARVLLQLPYFDRLKLIARHRRPACEVGRQQVLRRRDKLAAVPEADRVAVPGMCAVDVAVLLTDINTPYARPVIVDHVRLIRQVDELVRVRLKQPARVTWRLAVGQAIILDLTQLLLLAPALLVGSFVCRRQHSFANLTLESGSRRLDEHLHVGVARGYPQTVPAWNGGERS